MRKNKTKKKGHRTIYLPLSILLLILIISINTIGRKIVIGELSNIALIILFIIIGIVGSPYFILDILLPLITKN